MAPSKQLTLDLETHDRLDKLADLWSVPGARRLSRANAVQILVDLLPEMGMTQEMVNGVNLRRRPPGRPKTCMVCGDRGYFREFSQGPKIRCTNDWCVNGDNYEKWLARADGKG